jgi:hypothetical protein
MDGGILKYWAAAGGSGIVILKVPNTHYATFSGGVTVSEDTSTVPGFIIYSVTATSTASETVRFNAGFPLEYLVVAGGGGGGAIGAGGGGGAGGYRTATFPNVSLDGGSLAVEADIRWKVTGVPESRR